MIISNPIPYNYILDANGVVHKTLYYELWNWDITTDAFKYIYSVVPTGHTIISVNGVMINDDGNYGSVIPREQEPTIIIDGDVDVIFHVSTGSVFDDPAYDDDTVLRARLTIEYIEK